MSNHRHAPTPTLAPDPHATGGAAQLVVDVVVDAASLGHAVAAAVGASGEAVRDYNLFPLLGALARRNMAVRRLVVACPQVAVATGHADNTTWARSVVDRWQSWLVWQTEQLAVVPDVAFTALPGAFDGSGEVGVDDLVAWTALRLGASIADHGDADHEAVVVVSSDSDMWHLWSEVAPVRLFVAGGFTAGQVSRLVNQSVPFLNLPATELAGFARDVEPSSGTPTGTLAGNPDAGSEVRVVTGTEAHQTGVRRDIVDDDVVCVHTPAEGGTFQASSPLNRVPDPPGRQGADGAGVEGDNDDLAWANTVAVVDPYGLHLAIRRAIGVGGLVQPDAVRELLESLGWDAPVAVLAVVPDLSAAHAGDGVLPDATVAAWWDRDGELDELADALDGDGDPLTQARRAELRAVQRGANGADAAAVMSVKRLSTGMVADVWRATRWAPGANVVVATEDPGIAWLLTVLSLVDPEVAQPVRLGLHPHRVTIVDGPDDLAGLGAIGPAPVVVLTEHLAAGLVGAVGRPYARSLRDRLGDLVRTPVRVVAQGVEPETGGLVVRVVPVVAEAAGDTAVGEAAEDRLGVIDTVIHANGSVLRGDVEHLAEVLESQGGVVGLRLDPTAPCAVPEVVVDSTSHHGDHPGGADGAADGEREARVVVREGHRLWVDLDFDGVADVAVAIGHDTSSYRPDDVVAIRRVDDGGRRWALVDPGPADGVATEPHVVLQVVAPGAGGATAIDPNTGDTGWVEPMPGETEVHNATHLFAVEVGRHDDGSVQWMALSSGLAHLDAMLGS